MIGLVKLMLLTSALGTATAAIVAQTPSSTTHTPELLWPSGAPMAQGTGHADRPTITAYIPAHNPTRTAVIIAPGGGYQHLSMQKEGEDIALWLNAHGVAGFVLKYRLGPTYHHPVELGDAQRAIRTVRAHSEALGVASDKIGIWGFSAGGHLAASAGTMFSPGSETSDPIDRQSSRPDFLILAYPVMTFDGPYAHISSRNNLLGENPTPEMIAALSPEKHVTTETPPTFLFVTTEDKAVPVMNSVLFFSALTAQKVPAEMHIFAHGPHGVGLAPGYPELKGWPDLLATWMRGLGLMAPPVTIATPIPSS